MEKFRVHHILCTNLYQGMGYSGDFCKNMTEVVQKLREHPEMEVELVCSTDMICKNCPNLTESGECVQDANHVTIKDELLREKIGLVKHQSYSYQELCQLTAEHLTEEDFTESCQNCLWYKQKLCDYTVLKKNLVKMGT
ncbi:MAG: DUF1284 domain-containing protein [Roseburia sp.]